MKKLTLEECIEKLKFLYGDKFDYSSAIYTSSRNPITLTCPKHGDFDVYANNALLGKAVCVKCLSELERDRFILKGREKFGDKFNLDSVDFKGVTKETTFSCSKHGKFITTPYRFLNSMYGCPKCKYPEKEAVEIPSQEEKELLKTAKWKEKCRQIHSNKYNYDKVEKLHKLKEKVIITCPIHGDFEQTAESHLLGKGCNKCAQELRANSSRLSFKAFIKRAKEVHGDAYQYSEYLGMHTKIPIVCKKHGIFYLTPHNHLNGYGCPVCSSSRGEGIIREYLQSNGISFQELVKITFPFKIKMSNYLVVDFLVEYQEKSYIIEYNGILHYEYVPHFHKGGVVDFEKQQFRDKILLEYCTSNNITLLELKYNLSTEDIHNKLNNIFENESTQTLSKFSCCSSMVGQTP